MSLNMFKNKLYNMIIAVSLVVAIVTVTSYVPEMFTETLLTGRKTGKQQMKKMVTLQK